MGLSKLDLFYRRLILTKFYTRGWGNPQDIKKILKLHKTISDREKCSKLVSPSYPVSIDKIINKDDCTLLRGSFVSPFVHFLPDLMPKVVQTVRFEVVLPKPGYLPLAPSHKVPACIHMAGTGDHGFTRRREILAKPLLNHGISSVLLENPFYGSRKPKEQFRSGLLHVNDIFVMGTCLILESQVLLHWLTKMGFGPLGLTGISMGGHMAALAATNWPQPIALIPCMSWTSASIVFTEGVLSKAIPWRVLEAQYSRDPAYEQEITDMLQRVDSYHLGQSFVKENGGIVSFKTIQEKIRTVGEESRLDAKRLNEKRRQQETVRFMKGVMDQMTHLGNYSAPIDPTLVTFVVAKDDAYFPPHKLTPIQQLWPGCQVRELDTGHIAGYLVYYNTFVRAIVDTFKRFNHRDVPESRVIQETQSLQQNSVSLLNSLRAFTLKA